MRSRSVIPPSFCEGVAASSFFSLPSADFALKRFSSIVSTVLTLCLKLVSSSATSSVKTPPKHTRHRVVFAGGLGRRGRGRAGLTQRRSACHQTRFVALGARLHAIVVALDLELRLSLSVAVFGLHVEWWRHPQILARGIDDLGALFWSIIGLALLRR